MLENEKQRRWWFANHPEYSNSRKGERNNQDNDGHDDRETVSPESVDAYVDEALKHVRGTVAGLLKSFKRHFGTQAEDGYNERRYSGDPGKGPTTNDTYSHPLDRSHGSASLSGRGMPQFENEEPEQDALSILDMYQLARSLSPPTMETSAKFLREVVKRLVRDAAKKKGNRPPARLPPEGTPERNAIEAAREQGIRLKKAQELKDIKAGGKGSGVWKDEELAGIRNTGKWPDDAVWHHDPTVANRPDLAADPRSVHLMRGGKKAHLRDGHQGNYQNPRIDVPKKDSPPKD